MIVGGAALLTRGGKTFPLGYGGSVAIGRGEVHRIENPGPNELMFIEVQHGDRLEEDDIPGSKTTMGGYKGPDLMTPLIIKPDRKLL